MPHVQTRLDLPARKSSRVRTAPAGGAKMVVEESSTATTTRASSKGRPQLVVAHDLVEQSPKTPRRGRRQPAAADILMTTPQRTPRRRGAGSPSAEAASEASPPKAARLEELKENVSAVKVVASPTVLFNKLCLDSPAVRQPFSARKTDPEADNNQLLSPIKNVKRSQLFSPVKQPLQQQQQLLSPLKNAKRTQLSSPGKHLSQQSIEDLLWSPDKKKTTTTATTPAKKHQQLTQQSIKDMLCSPDKSVVKLSLPLLSAAAAAASRGGGSPLRQTGPPAAADLFGTPTKEAATTASARVRSKDARLSQLVSPRKALTPLMKSMQDGGEVRGSPRQTRMVEARESPRKVIVTMRESPRKAPAARIARESARGSPRKVATLEELESLLCSPLKTTTGLVVLPPPVTRSPRKPQTPSKSPRKTLTSGSLFAGSPRRPADLFASAARPAVTAPPSTPATSVSLFKADISQFQTARQALHTGTPSELVCRGEQVEAMSKWLDTHLVGARPGSLYVSGAPGTGKTATLTHLLATRGSAHQAVFINCMVLKSSMAIYKEVATQLAPKETVRTEKEALKAIEKTITAKGPMIMLVLDEVDQLESKNQDVLYTVFEWPALSSSRLALVGIANTLDLTDRVLPRLQVKAAYTPTLVHYPPYTKLQIIEIINRRLADSGVDSAVIHPRAIAFLAGKISALSGDLRKALDVCRRALEQAETEARKQTLLKPLTPRGLNSPSKSPQKGYRLPKPTAQLGQVDLPNIMKVFNQVYGSKLSAGLSTGAGGIPTQQKILLACLLLMLKKGNTKEVTMGKLLETYAKVCKKRGLTAPDETATVGMVQLLESRGMVAYCAGTKAGAKAAPRYAKVTLRLDEKEVEMALQDKTLLASIVEDTSCLAN